jgi:probable phosphoglycerate mutase
MRVVLARHGNTFEPGERPVWIGARTDLALVAKGREQATRIGEALKAADLAPRRALAGPLKRTRETARLALSAAGVADVDVEIDPRLTEIDYGIWEGKSSDEIRSMGWQEELRAWDQEGAWPAQAGWPSSHSDYLGAFMNVLTNVRQRRVEPALIVSSNGVFKLFASLVDPSAGAKRMATGHLSLLNVQPASNRVLCWDLAPEAFSDWVRRN